MRTTYEYCKILADDNLHNVAKFGLDDADKKEQKRAIVEQRLQEIQAYRETPTVLRDTIDEVQGTQRPQDESESLKISNFDKPDTRSLFERYGERTEQPKQEQEQHQPEPPSTPTQTSTETKSKDIIE